jgi:hypothetical protein
MAYEWRRSRTLPNVSGKARLGPRHVAIISSQFLSLYAAQKVALGRAVRTCGIARRPALQLRGAARYRDTGRRGDEDRFPRRDRCSGERCGRRS